ncbi:efflux RND transporter periplasmic adaptor subunit [Pseudoalteromonas phenolica]|uniref:efflux RND transporter periplasmic adaptor subunit n=1 Tax=Pseudoalteromonas phenolica TaxID=161398 RepID=UPI00384FC6C3
MANLFFRKKRLTKSLLFLSLMFISNVHAQVVRYSEVLEKEEQEQIRVVGTLKAYQTANIAISESGLVTQVLVNDGDYVKKGDQLLKIDDRRLKAQVDQLRAEHAAAKENLKAAEAEFERAQSDYQAYLTSQKNNAVSKQQLERSRADANSAKANMLAAKQNVDAVKASLTLANVKLSDTQLFAPFSGQVVARHAELGQWLSAGDTAFTVTSFDKLEAWLDVPERLSHLKHSEALSVPLQSASALATSNKVKVINQIDSRARTFKVIAEISHPGFMPGMSVSAWLATNAKSSTLMVPKDALIQRGGSYFVYKVNTDGDKQSAQSVPVKVKFHSSGWVAIDSAVLVNGDKVVTEGNERLMPGPVVAVPDTQVSSQSVSENVN